MATFILNERGTTNTSQNANATCRGLPIATLFSPKSLCLKVSLHGHRRHGTAQSNLCCLETRISSKLTFRRASQKKHARKKTIHSSQVTSAPLIHTISDKRLPIMLVIRSVEWVSSWLRQTRTLIDKNHSLAKKSGPKTLGKMSSHCNPAHNQKHGKKQHVRTNPPSREGTPPTPY